MHATKADIESDQPKICQIDSLNSKSTLQRTSRKKELPDLVSHLGKQQMYQK